MFNQVKFRRSAAAASIGLFLGLSAHAMAPNTTSSSGENNDRQTTTVEFGPYKVQVPKGGYYDRFRMNPDLDEVAKDPAAGNIDYFRTIPKKMVETRVGKVW